jgi:RNA polymerase sigma-70 factor (ECF subfamily)
MMTEKMWSWVRISKEHFPKANGPIRYLPDKRTCVMPVKLQPAKVYAVWINAGKFNAFRDTDNHPAVPYLLVFQTKE